MSVYDSRSASGVALASTCARRAAFARASIRRCSGDAITRAGRAAFTRRRAAPIVASLVVASVAACAPSFHAGALPGAPQDATFVDVDGVHVHYRESGAGPAVVLIHGFGASLESWGGVAPVLAQRHRVIAIDLKGFGWTSRPEGDYSPAAHAKLVWGVLDKLGVTDVAIVGHSWGSSVALSMAVAQPARVRRVALYDAYVYDEQVPSFFRWAQKAGLGEWLLGLYYRERIDERAPLAYRDERFVTEARVERVEAELARPGAVAAALASVRGHHFEALHRQLAGFAKPVLLLWGRDDQITPVRFGEQLANELANARLVVYPRCGHIPMVEARLPSTRDLAAFLAEGERDEGRSGRSDGGNRGGDGGGDHVDGGGGGSGGAAASGGGDAGGAAPAAGAAAGGADGSVEPLAVTAAPVEQRAPVAMERTLPLGADLAALGAELTPRQYAAPREKLELVLHGAMRVREAGLYNLDLDRGLDSTGQPVFPVPLSGGQRLDAGDLRLRSDIALYAPGVGVAVKTRIDWLDNVALGGSPDLDGGSPATTRGQRPMTIVLKRAWGEALTPVGVLAVGRMGAHFGLGIAANGGDCEDCNGGDASDRAAFVSPLFGHLVAFAYDIASRGPFTESRDGSRPITVENTTAVAGPTLAILNVHAPATLARRADAGRTTLEYAGYVTYRTQAKDVPASYLPTAMPAGFTANDVVARGFSATGTGGWLRVTRAGFRFEAELAYAHARIEQPSLIPGAAITTPVTSDQLGVAVQSEVTSSTFAGGLDAGYASGDDAPGFGAFPQAGQVAPPPGAFDGPQANLPRDRTVDNFRFHPDYHVDQILFREILGTITDAIYVRPHVHARLLDVGPGRLELGAALIASWAVQATSTPSGERALGFELDPQLRYATRDGFAATLDYGVFIPGAAWRNSMLEAKPAQVFRARLAYLF